jgi:hypothetical protein
MTDSQAFQYYATQSRVTNPGDMAPLFADLPRDIPSLRRIASGLVTHYRADDLNALGIPEERIREINTRHVEPMLRRIIELDDRPLSAERPKQRRLVGCCRDFTVLFLAMLRQQGIPARARVGFGSYFVKDWLLDHELAEVWDEQEQRWRLIDPQMPDTFADSTDGADIDALDVPRDRFQVGGEAWARCRTQEADPERYVVDPGLDIPVTRGWLQLRHNLVQDLAALNKREMILWDTWGLLDDNPIPTDQGTMLDRIATLTRQDDPSLAEIEALHRDTPDVAVPGVVTNFNPAAGPPAEVSV